MSVNKKEKIMQESQGTTTKLSAASIFFFFFASSCLTDQKLFCKMINYTKFITLLSLPKCKNFLILLEPHYTVHWWKIVFKHP